MKVALLSLFMLTLWLPATASATDVYRWIDANGTPSYAERPPEGVDYVKMKIHGGENNTKAHSQFISGSSDPQSESTPRSNTPATQSSPTKKTTP